MNQKLLNMMEMIGNVKRRDQISENPFDKASIKFETKTYFEFECKLQCLHLRYFWFATHAWSNIFPFKYQLQGIILFIWTSIVNDVVCVSKRYSAINHLMFVAVKLRVSLSLITEKGKIKAKFNLWHKQRDTRAWGRKSSSIVANEA